MYDELSPFQRALADGTFADNARDVVAAILKAKVPMKPVPELAGQYMWTSGFPETNRLLWLMPTSEYGIAVIEAPIDDQGPFTIWHALASNELWRWGRRQSPHYTAKLGGLCKNLGLSMPDDRMVKYVMEFAFPPDWTNQKGKQRTNMQIHCILSTDLVTATKRLTGSKNGGAYCSTKIIGNNKTPASKGCGFISRASYFGGARFSDGLANSCFCGLENSKHEERFFGFEDLQWNDEAWTGMQNTGLGRSVLCLLMVFTAYIRNQLHA